MGKECGVKECRENVAKNMNVKGRIIGLCGRHTKDVGRYLSEVSGLRFSDVEVFFGFRTRGEQCKPDSYEKKKRKEGKLKRRRRWRRAQQEVRGDEE